MMIMTPEYFKVRRHIWHKFQHYRNLRDLMRFIESHHYPPDLLQQVLNDVLPLIEQEKFLEAKDTLSGINKQRILRRYQK